MLKGAWFLLKLTYRYSKSAIVYLVLEQIVNFVIPISSIVIPKYIIDGLVNGKDVGYIFFFVALLVGLQLFGSVLSNFFHTQYFIKKFIVSNAYKINMSDVLLQADIEQLEKASFQDLQEKSQRFLTADGYGFGGVLDIAARAFSKVVLLFTIIAIIINLNPIIIFIYILLVLCNSFVSSKIKKANIELDLQRPAQERRMRYYSTICSNIKYAKEVRLENMLTWIKKKLNERSNILKEFYQKSMYNSLISQLFASFTSFIQQVVAYAYLVYNILNNVFGIGSFTMYLNAINSFSSTVQDIMGCFIDLKRFDIYYASVEEYLSIPQKLRDGKKEHLKLNQSPVIEFVNVSFRYPGNDHYQINNLSIKIKAGETLSIIGENGAGKTTFIKLLTRLYEPTEGKILLNGVNINQFDYDDYMRIFSVVFQDFNLYSCTLKENICFSDEVSTEEADKITDALIRSGFGGKLNNIQKGIDVSIGKEFDDEGFEPSGGEGQKIALARAIYKNANIMILDEPTSALDPRAEFEIYSKFKELVQSKTAIYISHRLAICRFCDKIAFFKNGEIIEYGNHDELLKLDGSYAELFNIQAQYYI